MATQQRFEANTLAEVLAKVQREVGSDAKIASAQRVRSGGAFGFFQRERFEVVVDVPDTPAQPEPETETAGEYSPASLLELAQQVNREETRTTDPSLSTESEAFAEVLSRVAYQADLRSLEGNPKAKDEEVIDEPAEPIVPGRPAFLDQQSAPAPTIDAPTAAVVAHTVDETVTAQEQQAPAETEATTEPADLPSEPVVAEPVVAEPVVAEPVSVQPQSEAAILAEVAGEPEPLVAQPLVPAPVSHASQVPAQPETPAPLAVPVTRTRITDHPLAQLGLPAGLIPVEPSTDIIDLRSTLADTLSQRLPKVPVIRPSRGSIIAVVGHRDEAVRIAGDLANEFGRPDEEIVVASQHIKGKPADNVLRTIENAEDAQRSWSRRNRPTIVAIEAYPGSRDTAWAEHVLTALEPIATFGVTDATRKSEDVVAWADELGGIDCIALNNIEETVSPAEILRTGIPVERIDGRKATPDYWALLLTERLTA